MQAMQHVLPLFHRLSSSLPPAASKFRESSFGRRLMTTIAASARWLLTLGLLGRTAGFTLSTAALVPSPSGARPELLRRFSAATYQEVLRPARNLIPGLFSYVDCRPFDDVTTEGRWFLATNLAFALTGGAMAMEGGSPGLGVCFELAGT